ncbi:MAG: hypothetical protein K8963_01835, partial [Proteobacteria bacterium]|nr:hypothetical protein [Pseudomonadota bacterium]
NGEQVRYQARYDANQRLLFVSEEVIGADVVTDAIVSATFVREVTTEGADARVDWQGEAGGNILTAELSVSSTDTLVINLPSDRALSLTGGGTTRIHDTGVDIGTTFTGSNIVRVLKEDRAYFDYVSTNSSALSVADLDLLEQQANERSYALGLFRIEDTTKTYLESDIEIRHANSSIDKSGGGGGGDGAALPTDPADGDFARYNATDKVWEAVSLTLPPTPAADRYFRDNEEVEETGNITIPAAMVSQYKAISFYYASNQAPRADRIRWDVAYLPKIMITTTAQRLVPTNGTGLIQVLRNSGGDITLLQGQVITSNGALGAPELSGSSSFPTVIK